MLRINNDGVQTSPVWTITKDVAPPPPVRLEGLGGGQVQVGPGLVLGVAQVERLTCMFPLLVLMSTVLPVNVPGGPLCQSAGDGAGVQ